MVTSFEEQKRTFYRNVDGSSGMDAGRMLEELFSTEEHITRKSQGGTFLPESVLVKQGFEMETIKQKISPKDVMLDPVLGMCYRINTITINNDWQQTTGRRDVAQRAPMPAITEGAKPKKRQRMLALEDGNAEEEEANNVGKKNDDSKSTSSSSSSSSSSSGKKKKKSKKSKKSSKKSKKDKKNKKDKKESAADRRAREARERAEQRESTKLASAATKASHSVIEKATPVIESTEALLLRHEVTLVADVVKGPVKSGLDTLRKYTESARECLAKDGASPSPDLHAVIAEISALRKKCSLLTSVLAMMAKASACGSNGV